MITYANLSEKDTAFRSLTGMSFDEFERLYRDWSEADARCRSREGRTRRTKQARI
nr:hypothetical protein [Gemmatimonadota bacterium]